MKNKRAAFIGLLTALALVGGSTAWAANKPSISSATTSFTFTYSPNADQSSSGASISIKSNKYAGSYYVAFAQTSLTSSSGDALAYAVYDNSGNQLSTDGSPANTNEVLTGTFASSSTSVTTKFPFTIRILSSALPSAKTYTLKMTARLYAAAFSASASPSYAATKTITVKVKVASHLDVAVMPSDSTYSASYSGTDLPIDIGDIEGGDTATAYVAVRSNIVYYLYLASANGGYLATTSDSNSTIPYTLTANGNLVAFSAAATKTAIASSAAATYIAGATYELIVTISEFSILPSPGTYSDTITVTVSSS